MSDHADALVVFGLTGDLARKMTLPALYRLTEQGHLGCAVKIARSFARIHETNLKKQGILPLTFADPADYDRFEAGDRVSVTGLHALEPGRPVTVRVRKPDGRTLTVETRHSLTREQIAWFRAGSALNAGQPLDPATGETASLGDVRLRSGDTKAKPGEDV